MDEFLAPDGLDRQGWYTVGNAPVGGGWPARAIFEAMAADPVLVAYVPIDVLGMLTDLNPGGLYF